MDTANKTKNNNSYLNQITLLKILSGQAATPPRTGSRVSPKDYDIHEIAELSRLNDEREVVRYLFILEGQKLVSPQPEGDFTSRNWRITENGVKVLKTISQSAT